MGVEIAGDNVGAKKDVKVPEADEKYRTTDIEMAAALMTLGHKFLDVEEKKERRGRRILFVFEHNVVKDDLVKWLNNELSCEPRLLLNNLRDLKNLVHNKGFK